MVLSYGSTSRVSLFIQLSYASTSPALSDRSRFPNFYQLEMPDHASNPAKIALLKEFNWRRVATINVAEESYHTPVSIVNLIAK